MNRLLTRAFALTIFAMAIAQAHASERVDHFEGEPAATLDEALANLTEYNQRLAAVLESESLDAAALHEIHQLSYTLENALQRIDTELETLAETLEELHLASERADVEVTTRSARDYLETADKIAP